MVGFNVTLIPCQISKVVFQASLIPPRINFEVHSENIAVHLGVWIAVSCTAFIFTTAFCFLATLWR